MFLCTYRCILCKFSGICHIFRLARPTFVPPSYSYTFLTVSARTNERPNEHQNDCLCFWGAQWNLSCACLKLTMCCAVQCCFVYIIHAYQKQCTEGFRFVFRDMRISKYLISTLFYVCYVCVFCPVYHFFFLLHSLHTVLHVFAWQRGKKYNSFFWSWRFQCISDSMCIFHDLT